MKKLFILPLLMFAACGDAVVNDSDVGNNNVNASDTENSTAGTNGAAQDGNTAQVDANGSGAAEDMPEFNIPEQNPKPPLAPRIQQSYKPKRDPQFHFETKEITDAQLGEFYVEVDVSIDKQPVGTMTFVFWPEKAPITVRNFLRYADEGFYDGKVYHRILRDFMIQGGSSDNKASGKGPHGMIKGEFSNDPKWAHRYGVLSMARGGSPDSASGQYFVITDSAAPSVKNLDGKYASFGIMVHGVATLEAIAEVKTTMNPMNGEPSVPLQTVVVDEMRVVRGTPTVTEEVKRPPFDLKGQAERVRIQHILISFAGTGTTATRSKEEAEALAMDILKQAQGGANFDELVRAHTDDPGSVANTPPGSYSLLNTRQKAPEYTEEQLAEKAELEKAAQELQTELLAKVNAKTITMDDAKAEFFASETMTKLSTYSWMPRAQMVSGFGDTAFSLEVGEVGICNHDPAASRFGWHIIKRYE
ncbi:MAG: peptidylprolyl isomerase [Planctomycetota bacterium]|jgi:cyclophilin family peptidyl-prolyl cis-trans isomerase|nr:peptidylprolyl isomerase [Planctomycetota bacterium]